jgi:hypothetical protein
MNLLFASALIAMATLGADKPMVGKSSIRSMPVDRTPESDTVSLKIAVPKNEQLISNPVWVQFKIEGYSLGSASSQFDRADELVVSKMGQTVHVVVDNEPYIAVNEPAIDPFSDQGYFYQTSYKFELPKKLSKGMHTLRIFPTRSYGESLKGSNTFQAMSFYVGSLEGGMQVDLSQPYLTYNEPSDQMYLVENKPVLLDFLISNAELSPDGYKVRLTIDGEVNRVLPFWQPYYIYGLKKGKHKIRLELIDENNKIVPGPFNDVERQITIH